MTEHLYPACLIGNDRTSSPGVTTSSLGVGRHYLGSESDLTVTHGRFCTPPCVLCGLLRGRSGSFDAFDAPRRLRDAARLVGASALRPKGVEARGYTVSAAVA